LQRVIPECKTHAQDRGRHQDSEENPMSRLDETCPQMWPGKADVEEGRFGRIHFLRQIIAKCKYIKPKTVGVPMSEALDAARDWIERSVKAGKVFYRLR